MANKNNPKLDRRQFLKQSTIAAAALTAGLSVKSVNAGKRKRLGTEKKVIVLGIDAMDPDMSESLMDAGMLPNFDKLRRSGGYQRLGTSKPPLSPVAWANFTTGANPGTHGIFDFVVPDSRLPGRTRDSIAQTRAGSGIAVGKYVLPVFRKPKTILMRQGIPFWDYLDQAGISSDVYLVPSNYPPSRSKHGHHRSLSGMGTPDLMGSLGTYQYFAEDVPVQPKKRNSGKHHRLIFKNQTAKAELLGPKNIFLRNRKHGTIKFFIHRDPQAKIAVIEIQGQKILLKQGQWSDWVKVNFTLSMPKLMPDEHINGICQIYLQQFSPVFRLYISPISIDPAEPAMRISEPDGFSSEISKELGPFCMVGFAEAFKARINNVLTDKEYAVQADMVLQSRLKLLDYALKHYDDGFLFFYFSSLDLQSHMFWWNSNKKNPARRRSQTIKYHNHIKKLYTKMDNILGDVLEHYGDRATIIVMSDHGFSYFTRYFCLNTWLRNNGYIRPMHCTSLRPDKTGLRIGVDWHTTRAYGIGMNDLYLNLKGREPEGIVEPQEREGLLQELVAKLEAVRDVDGSAVIHKAYRSDKVYSGPVLKRAPDLILGFHRGYRGLNPADAYGTLARNVFAENRLAWSADHCFAAEDIPGVIFSNKPIGAASPSLVDVAPSILTEYGLEIPSSMQGKNIFTT